MSYSSYPSYIDTTSDIDEEPRLGHTWRDDKGQVNSTVRLGFANLAFRHPHHARAVAAACTAAAEAMEAMEAIEVQAQAEADLPGRTLAP